MSATAKSKAPGPFPPPGTLKAKLANLIPRANVVVYRWSGGRLGGRMEGLPVLILHTVGRKSGKARQSPLLYIQDGDDYVVVGSRGGSDAPPAWSLNHARTTRDIPLIVLTPVRSSAA